MNRSRVSVVIFAVFALIFPIMIHGCGGGGGGGGSSSSTSPSQPTMNASAAGIWNGTAYSNITKTYKPITGMIAENNRAHFVSVSEGVASPVLSSSALAHSERHPISGTPLLRDKRELLLREYGPAASIKAERTIFADTVGQVATFHAYNFATGSSYQTTATCRSVTSYGGYSLFIYVENAEWSRDPGRFNNTILNNLSSNFFNTILPIEKTYFGSPPGVDFTIYLLDIKDASGNTYVSGYFDSENELPPRIGNQSNGRHMVYMDSKEGTPGNIASYGTLAHEFNHFIHYNYDPYEATWVEEGMAGLARYVCGYGPHVSHVNAFGLAPTTSLTAWGGSLENYGATFLFMLYLQERYGGSAITKAIIANNGTGIAGINTVLFIKGYSVTFNEVFKNWIIANYLNNSSISSGDYGYQANFSITGITNAPGNIQVTSTVNTYPASGSGIIHRYAAEYVKFTNLGGTSNIFVLIPYNLDEGVDHDYSYTARLGSLILNLTGINSPVGASGVKQGGSNPIPAVATNLSSSNVIPIDSGGGEGIGSSGTQYAGTVSMSGTTLSGEAMAYAPFGATFLDGNHLGPLTISATVNERVSINGTYSGGGDIGTLSLAYDPLYQRPSSLAAIQGTWRVNNDAALGTVEFVISPAGAVTGYTGTGCMITGNFSTINPAYNVYQVDIVLSNCATGNGTYSGLATLTGTSLQNDTMISGISNATTSIVGAFRRSSTTGSLSYGRDDS